MTSAADLYRALDGAACFLDGARSTDGLWRDFRTLAGTSSSWVTAFVCHAVAASGRLEDHVATAIRGLLRRQRPSGGWSYSSTVPTDCDSSAWVLLAFATVRSWRLSSVVDRGLRYLRAHQEPASGGFRTYIVDDEIHRYIKMPSAMVDGWLEAHPSVTAATLIALLLHGISPDDPAVRAAGSFVRNSRDQRGLWSAYWWKGWSYSTYQGLRSSLLAGMCQPEAAAETIHTVIAEQLADGSWSDDAEVRGEAFATAFGMLTLLLLPEAESLHSSAAAAAWLLQHQRSDGSWPVTPILRIPPPMLRDPASRAEWRTNEPGTGVILEDERRIFTTASVVWALSVYARMAAPGW